jgi:predicted Fe-Mo cluster-binding NifX family protein
LCHCEEGSDEAISGPELTTQMRLLRFARNDRITGDLLGRENQESHRSGCKKAFPPDLKCANSRLGCSIKDANVTPPNTMKVLIPLLGDDISPRFDLAPEAVIAIIDPTGTVTVEKSIVLSHASAEALCSLIITEKVEMVVCCAIEDEYYQYLIWKKVKVVDSVMGSCSKALERLGAGTIENGDIFLDR